MQLYYMASSVSGQDDPNRALWLATRVGKMEPSCLLGTTRCIPQAKLPRKPYNKSFIDQVCSVKMTGYWPCSFFASLWTSTSSRSINTQKKNSANIQPSWPHTWSITHMYMEATSKVEHNKDFLCVRSSSNTQTVKHCKKMFCSILLLAGYCRWWCSGYSGWSGKNGAL